jgi:polar amino acid transport system substrate-binding protein
MIKKSAMIFLALVLAVGMVSSVYAGTLDDIAMRGELRVACQTQGPPFSFVDKDGNRTGSSVDLCRLMAKEMGVKVKFLNYDWDGLIPALLSKKADMLAADMTPTLKRAMKIAFSTPFMYTGSVVFMKTNSPFKSVEDCRNQA